MFLHHTALFSAQELQICIPGGIQGQAGGGSGQPGLVVGDPAHSRGLKLNDHCGPFQPRPFYDSMILCAGDVRGSMEGKITMLSRSNFTVFEDAAKLAGRERQIKIHIIGVRGNCQHILHIPKPASTRSSSNTLK